MWLLCTTLVCKSRIWLNNIILGNFCAQRQYELSFDYLPPSPSPKFWPWLSGPESILTVFCPLPPYPNHPRSNPAACHYQVVFIIHDSKSLSWTLKKKKISTFVVWMSFLSDSSLIKLSYTAFLTGIFLKSIDKFNEDGENQISVDSKANMKPLLEGNWDNLWLHLQLCLHLVCFNKKECKVANLLPLVYWLANLKIYFGWFC